jgi:hypothetical protein
VRVSGEGLQRVDEIKSAAGRGTVPLPRFAVEMLGRRRTLPYFGQQAVIFPSTAGTLRDPNNFGKESRNARDELGVPQITTQLPQDGRNADRRRGSIGANRRRPSRPLECVHDPGPLYGPGPSPHSSGRSARPNRRQKR